MCLYLELLEAVRRTPPVCNRVPAVGWLGNSLWSRVVGRRAHESGNLGVLSTRSARAGETNPDAARYKKRKDRPDLYTNKWDGSEYKGSPFNVLNVILAVSVLVPLLGIGFALWSYGTLWG